MELETLFTASKWEILRHLGEEALSPLELAERSNTSLANISQQLRLLEMAGLVKSHRIPNREKGLPRVKYALAEEKVYFIAAAPNFVEKKFFEMSDYNKITLRIWFYENTQVRYALEKAFWQIEHLLERIQGLGVLSSSRDHVELCVLSDLDQSELPEITVENGQEIVNVSFKLLYEATDA